MVFYLGWLGDLGVGDFKLRFKGLDCFVKRVLGRGYSKCKGFEVGKGFLCFEIFWNGVFKIDYIVGREERNFWNKVRKIF